MHLLVEIPWKKLKTCEINKSGSSTMQAWRSVSGPPIIALFYHPHRLDQPPPFHWCQHGLEVETVMEFGGRLFLLLRHSGGTIKHLHWKICALSCHPWTSTNITLASDITCINLVPTRLLRRFTTRLCSSHLCGDATRRLPSKGNTAGCKIKSCTAQDIQNSTIGALWRSPAGSPHRRHESVAAVPLEGNLLLVGLAGGSSMAI